MSKIVSTRLNNEELTMLNEIAEKESLDRASLIRKMLLDQIRHYKLRSFGELYRKGVVSLQEAATGAKVSVYEMMEYVEAEKIRPPIESEEEMQADLERSKKIFAKMHDS